MSRERQNIFKKKKRKQQNGTSLSRARELYFCSTVAKMTAVAQMFHLMFFKPREQVDRERVIQRGSIGGKTVNINGNGSEGEKGETKKQMRMRGVEKNISLRDAKFCICQPEVCVCVCARLLSRVW